MVNKDQEHQCQSQPLKRKANRKKKIGVLGENFSKKFEPRTKRSPAIGFTLVDNDSDDDCDDGDGNGGGIHGQIQSSSYIIKHPETKPIIIEDQFALHQQGFSTPRSVWKNGKKNE